MKKIAIIGSTAYEKKMVAYKERLEESGQQYEVRLPALDHMPDLNELDICSHNREMIEWAEEVHLIWDGRSIGTLFDLGMAFALRKPLVIQDINPKMFLNFLNQYEIDSLVRSEKNG